MKPDLILGSLRKSQIITSVIIIVVQFLLLLLISWNAVNDNEQKASIAADEIAVILAEPLYNVDNQQVKRIADALVTSGRISSLHIESSFGEMIYRNQTGESSQWISPETRDISYRDIDLGTVTMQFSDAELLSTIQLFGSGVVLLVVIVLILSLFANELWIGRRVRRVFTNLAEGINQIPVSGYTYQIP
ncbi:MAG: hypothetical protein ACOCVC_08245, partial [Spirochaeta sp.]